MKFIRASNRSLVLFITDNDSVTVNTKKTKSLYISYCVPLYPLPSFPNTFIVCCLYCLYLYYPIPFLYVVFITFTFITIYLIYLYLLYSYLFYLPLLPNTFFSCTFITVIPHKGKARGGYGCQFHQGDFPYPTDMCGI